eukprot:Opistho-2@78485
MSVAPLTVSKEVPEICHPTTFEAYPHHDSTACKSLSVAATDLLAFVKKLSSSLQEKYRVELIRVPCVTESRWRMCVKLDPVAWYDHLKGDVGRTNADSMARNYVNKMRDEARNRPAVDPSEHAVVTIPKYCTNVPCKSGKACRCKHSRACQTTIMRAGCERVCGFFVVDELHLKNDTGKKLTEFHLICRHEPIRDVLLVPKRHGTNEEMLQDVNVWKAIAVFANDYRQIVSRALRRTLASGRRRTRWTRAPASMRSTVTATCTSS